MKKRIKIKIDIKYSLYKLYKQTTDNRQQIRDSNQQPNIKQNDHSGEMLYVRQGDCRQVSILPE